MKTYRNLYPQVWAFANLYEAWRKARRGKRGKAPVADFEYDLESNLLALQRELQARTYRPGRYTSFHIHEPKRRLISAAPFRDRVAHHALCNVIEPLYERRFIHDSYANRAGRGTHRALDRCTYFMRRFRYVLPCDVKQFFPSIDHAVLRAILARHIADEDVMWLVEQIMASGVGVLADEYDMTYFLGDDLFAANRPRGLPIGNLTSQFWANVYLNELDHFVKRDLKCRAYLRYVDDFLLFGDDKHQLQDWRAAVIGKLAELRLTIHEQRSQLRPVTDGVTFLGFVVFPTHRRLKRQNVVTARRRLKARRRAYHEAEITVEELTASVQGWVNHARYGDTYGLRRALLSSTPISVPVG